MLLKRVGKLLQTRFHSLGRLVYLFIMLPQSSHRATTSKALVRLPPAHRGSTNLAQAQMRTAASVLLV